MEILKTFSILLSIAACLVNRSSGENLHHKCIHDRIAVSGFNFVLIILLLLLLLFANTVQLQN